MDTERVLCKKCGTLILPATFAKNGGLCALCERGVEKEICGSCGKIAYGAIKIQNGKIICLKCNMLLSKATSDKWKKLHGKGSYVYDSENIWIKPYPEFEEVFANDDLKDIFYPLCSVILTEKETDRQVVLHLVSHNGLWIDETKESDTLNGTYAKFNIVNNRYSFTGNLSALKTDPKLKDILALLSSRFEDNKEKWLKKRTSARDFAKEIDFDRESIADDFDREYFIKAFYNYHLRKEKYIRKHKSNDFVLRKDLAQMNLFESFASSNFTNIAKELVVNNGDLLMDLIPIGVCWSDKYFDDGNNSFLFFDKAKSQVYNVNQYS